MESDPAKVHTVSHNYLKQFSDEARQSQQEKHHKLPSQIEHQSDYHFNISIVNIQFNVNSLLLQYVLLAYLPETCC